MNLFNLNREIKERSKENSLFSVKKGYFAREGNKLFFFKAKLRKKRKNDKNIYKVLFHFSFSFLKGKFLIYSNQIR